ncbi:Zinc finger, CCHC-type domain-containing protein [Strongyloides ratti]|uniref:Zinc finger, CCHC-type domain-containing protein n=1 Tax=Strongyloides ratti TaxID=34506 RepID=A0A090L0J1_STRRB|nr:Zinc finger, CCHC-type domain-containing protein [Strongyloides ratti]CEF61642.1 Zinc finger, CCHC-type domain-containing protein [Strongyloides ratti]
MNIAREYDQASYIELVEQLKKKHKDGIKKLQLEKPLDKSKAEETSELLKRKPKEDRIQKQIDIMIELLPSNVQQHVEDREFYKWNHFMAVVKSKYDLEKRKKFDDERFRKIDRGKRSQNNRNNKLTNPENKTETKGKLIICNSCGKQGHIAKNCYSKKEIKKTALLNVMGEEKNNSIELNSKTLFNLENKSTNNTDKTSEESMEKFSKLLYNSIKYKEHMPVSNINTNRIFLTPCRIYNMEVIRAIDTCADCTIISRHLKDSLKLEESDKEEKLSVTNGHISLKKLKGNLSITINDNTYELYDTLVAKHDFEGFDILLDTNLLKRLNAVLDCQTGKLIFDEDKTLANKAICHLSNKYTYENSSRFSLKLRKEYKDCFAESEMDITSGEVSAYAQFMLHENNRNNFGLTVCSRNYVYLTLPMRAKNSSHLLHIEMQKIFATLIKSKKLVLYNDDALLLTDDTDPEIHMNLLHQFFSLMRKYKLKTSFSKSSFFLKQVEFLSFTFDKEGWRPSQSSITKILNSKILQTKKQLLRFLLATNYFRSCIKNYSQKSAKLFALTTGKKNKNIILEGENLKLYKNIVEDLINPQKLNFGDFNKKYYLHTNSSETDLGGCLTQMIDINGVNVKKPLAFYSMKLPYSVRKRHSTYLELKAIVECLKHWSYILIKCKKGIEIICGYKPLITIKNTATEREDNVVPDWLSRLHEYEEKIQKEDKINLQMVNWTQLEESLHTYAVIKKRKRRRPKKLKVETISNENEFKLLQMIANQQTILKTEELKEYQEKDEIIQKALSTGFHLDYPIKKINGIVKIKINNRTIEDTKGQFSKKENEGFVCFIPQSLSNKIISLFHENRHFSYLKTRAMLRQLANCEKMAMNIRKVLNNCIECARRNSALTRQSSAKVTSYAEYSMDSLSLDLLCPAIPDEEFKYVMNVQDNYTRYLWNIPLKTKSYKEI